MKNFMIKKIFKTFFAITTAFFSFFFSSCYEDLYGRINEEVPLEKNGISGNTTSFTRCGNYIWHSNGNLYFKTNQQSSVYYKQTGEYNKQWQKAQVPSVANRENYIVKPTANFIVADDKNLYMIVYVWYENSRGENDIKSKHIYTTPITSSTNAAEIKAEDWSEIDVSAICGTNNINPSNARYNSIQIIFDNQAVNDAKRKAYARIYNINSGTYKVYLLKGSSALSLADEITENGAGSSTISAVYFPKDDKTYFSDYYAMAANNDYIYYSTSKTVSNNVSSSSVIYYANSYDNTKGFTKDGSSPTSVSLDAGGILSIGLTSNYILLGTTSGLKHVFLNDSVPSSNISNFSSGNNGGSIISEYVFKVFVLDPTKQDDTRSVENGTDEYCVSSIYGSISSSSDAFEETGLYAYYPGRGTWNRDGTTDEATGGN